MPNAKYICSQKQVCSCLLKVLIEHSNYIPNLILLAFSLILDILYLECRHQIRADQGQLDFSKLKIFHLRGFFSSSR